MPNLLCLPGTYNLEAFEVTFMPKSVKANYIEVKACFLIILLPFMLKRMEKLVGRHIRDEILGLQPLHR